MWTPTSCSAENPSSFHCKGNQQTTQPLQTICSFHSGPPQVFVFAYFNCLNPFFPSLDLPEPILVPAWPLCMQLTLTPVTEPHHMYTYGWPLQPCTSTPSALTPAAAAGPGPCHHTCACSWPLLPHTHTCRWHLPKNMHTTCPGHHCCLPQYLATRPRSPTKAQNIAYNLHEPLQL